MTFKNLQFYVADVVIDGMECLCTVSGHAGACWLVNRSPLRHLYHWAIAHLESRGSRHRVLCERCSHPVAYDDRVDAPAAITDASATKAARELIERTYTQGFQDGQRQTIDLAFVKSGQSLTERYTQ